MSASKGKIHKTSETIVLGALGLSALSLAAASAGFHAAGAVVAATGAFVGGLATVAGAAVANKVKEFYKAKNPNEQEKWDGKAAGVITAFSLACTIGTGVLVNQKLTADNEAPKPNQTTTEVTAAKTFNVEAGPNDECMVVRESATSAPHKPCDKTFEPK